jgi:hypothetical protein
MSRLDTAMRVACRDPELDLITRLHVLELIELRQNNWALDENIIAYFRQKLAQVSYSYRQCFGSGSTWIRIQLVARNRIQEG